MDRRLLVAAVGVVVPLEGGVFPSARSDSDRWESSGTGGELGLSCSGFARGVSSSDVAVIGGSLTCVVLLQS